jgi:thioredoxin 2
MSADAAGDSLHVVCPHCATKNRVGRDRLATVPPAVTAGSHFPRSAFDLTADVRPRIGGDATVVVDFWAAWCGPCRMMAPAYEKAAARVAPGVHLAKLDTEAEPAIASRFAIRGIPTLMAFRNGREVARQSGALPLPQLMQWITTHAQN